MLAPHRRALALVALVTFLVAATSTIGSAATPAPPLRWSSCGGGLECARLRVPLDDTKKGGPTISLAIARLRARNPQQRIGSLLINPGGPGASGVQFLREAGEGFPAAIRDRFDLVGFDPRGVGASAPIVCTPNLDPLFNLDFAPRDDAARQALVAGVSAFVAQCVAKAGAELPYLSTVRAARDMDRIRAAVGDKRLSYYGGSYGTYLGALYADQFPTKERAMVLDGAVDPALSATAQQVQQAQGFEHSLNLFLQSCGTVTHCAFAHNGDAGAAFDALRARVAAQPIPAGGAGNGRSLNATEFDIGVTQYLYSGRGEWMNLAQALDAADTGDGSSMLTSSDKYTERHADGTYDQIQSAFLAIGCLDGPDLGGLAGLRAIEEQAALVAPRVGRSVVNNSLPCAIWPVPVQAAPVPHAVGAPPILVVGNTDDPATPLAWAQGLSHELQNSVLLTVNSAQHTAYLSGNTCVDNAVDQYLVQGRPPAAGTRC